MLARSTVVDRVKFQPAYLELWQRGELGRRVTLGLEKLADCTLCPLNCHVNRLEDNKKVCRTGRYAVVSSYFAHFGEERCLRGSRGSGTIFFSWCNLRCVFCQNFEISWAGENRSVRPKELAAMMCRLEEQGCHNIYLVTPNTWCHRFWRPSCWRLSGAYVCRWFTTSTLTIRWTRFD
jgi:putative pyruvate formate lyase activating enzyme